MTESTNLKSIDTPFTKSLGVKFPIIGAPMFLVSNEELVSEISNAGALGSFPALNYRPIENYRAALKRMKEMTQKPIGVNIIVNKSNTRQYDDLKYALEAGVDLFITSLGNPKEVIKEAHKQGAKVYCDVTNLEHSLKVQDLGADGVIAVSTGAGGHAGPISPMVLIPWLKSALEIPVVAAGGITNGRNLLAALALGADAVHVGTRFIASKEAQVTQGYKDAILKSTPEDIMLTTRISGTPANVIQTEYIKKVGTDLPLALKILKSQKWAKNYIVPLIHYLGSKSLEQAAETPTWKTVWSAGQGVGLIDDILSAKEIVQQMVQGYYSALNELPSQQK